MIYSCSYTFKIPSSGFYQVSEKRFISKPTGQYEYVKNMDKKWYQFWKPSKIRQEIIEGIMVHDGCKLIFLHKDEVVESAFLNKIN